MTVPERHDWWMRALRTFIQAVIGAGLTIVFDDFITNIPDKYDFLSLLVATVIVATVQNYAEQRRWIPAIFKPTSSPLPNQATP